MDTKVKETADFNARAKKKEDVNAGVHEGDKAAAKVKVVYPLTGSFMRPQ